MKGPKVVLIGAGSVFFGRKTVWSMVSMEALRTGTLALVDTDPQKLEWMVSIAKRAAEAAKAPLTIEASTDRRQVLKGADFVILAFANEGVELRGVDSKVSTRYGMIMCSGDTIGPGGTFRTLREVPRQAEILKDVEKFCPDAWVINWVNPTAAMGIAMMRHFPKIKSLAICDVPQNPRFEGDILQRAGLLRRHEDLNDALLSRVKMRAGGVNHFIWLFELQYQGKDLLPKVRQSLFDDLAALNRREQHVVDDDHPSHEHEVIVRVSAQLADVFGYVPLCTGHTQEYLPYFQGHDCIKRGAVTINMWSVQRRRKWMKAGWTDMKNLATGKRPIADFLANTKPDHASEIIEAMWTGKRRRFNVNVRNNGAVPNMPDDALLELPCILDLNEAQPLPFGPFPRPILGMIQRVLDEHELAVEAAVTCDKKLLRRALISSMVAVSIPDCDRVMEELLRLERPYLPKGWYR